MSETIQINGMDYWPAMTMRWEKRGNKLFLQQMYRRAMYYYADETDVAWVDVPVVEQVESKGVE